MIKQNKLKLTLSSVVILLPILFGVLFWDRLPEQMATHWGASGEANGWSDKGFAVFGLPLLLLAVHWLCIVVTAKDPKNGGQNKKAFSMVFWLIPVVSVYTSVIMYTSSLGVKLEMNAWVVGFLGMMFIVVGNYLPKCKQNHTLGIKVPWTLNNEEN